MKKKLSLITNIRFISLSFFLCLGLNYSVARDKAIIIEFKDKGDNTQSTKAYTDQPVSKKYIREIEALGLHYKSGSDWLNLGIFNYSDADVLKKLSGLSFIKNMTYDTKEQNITPSFPPSNKFTTEEKLKSSINNRSANSTAFYLDQIIQLNGNYLQDLGYKGAGITIAMLDDGFPKANTLGALQHIYLSNRLLGTYDFYLNDSNVYAFDNHGTNTFSFIGGLKSNFSGSAPEASFYLFRTEVANDTLGRDYEGRTEEVFLAEALQRASELGVKVASISLGYTDNEGRGFNDGTPNHTWAEMDGHTTIAAKAVNIAASKGMLVCVSAGNEGAIPWKYLATPGDADSAFTIGAVDINGNPVSFSSYNFDTSMRVKPNVDALGKDASYINQSNGVSTGGGTSYSCPIIAGLSACLWQAFPSKTNWDIKTAIEQSASLYLNPTKHMGYGIPDFKKAYEKLSSPDFISNSKLENEFVIYPNPFNNSVDINNKGNSVISMVEIINNAGQIIYADNGFHKNSIALNDLPKGMYTLQIATSNGTLTKKLIKD